MDTSTTLAAISLGIIVAQAAWFLNNYFKEDVLPSAYDIAILGEPQAGKTTFVTSLFDSIFRRQISHQFKISGSPTIDKVNSDIALINSGLPPSPTKSSDIFTYRCEYHAPKRIFLKPENYKIQIGDYPGELSIDLSENEPGLVGSKFFEWTHSSDMIIYIVDGYKLNSEPLYGEHIFAFVRSTWQHILDKRPRSTNRPSIILIVTKTDLIAKSHNKIVGPNNSLDIVHLGADIVDLNFETLNESITPIANYLQNQTPHFNTYLYSHYLREPRGEPMNMDNIIRSILPNKRKVHNETRRPLFKDEMSTN